MRRIMLVLTAVVFLLIAVPIITLADDLDLGLSIHAGGEIDPTPGFGGIGNIDLTWTTNIGTLEFGPFFVMEGYHKNYYEPAYDIGYIDEKGSTTMFGVMVNWLYNYHPEKSSTYLLTGSGYAFAQSQYYEEFDDGTNDGDSYSASGVEFDLGVGHTFGNGFEARLQLPVVFQFTYDNFKVMPVLLLTAGYHFSI